MYQIKLNSIILNFDPATVSVPADGSSYDFMNEHWNNEVQKIQIEQKNGWAVLRGLSGFGSLQSENKVIEIEPALASVGDAREFLVHIALRQGNDPRRVNNAISDKAFNWGVLVALNWSNLGYAPGGIESVIVPTKRNAIYIGFVPINWSTLKVSNA